MKMTPLDIVDGSYADEDKSFSAQDTVNYLPTSAEQAGTRTPTMLKTPPGLKPAVLIGVNNGTMQVAGPVRGTYNAEGRFFAVAGNQLFQISSAGIAIPLGTVPGVGRVSFAHNQVTNGNEILVNNGNAGYIYSTVTQVFQRITDTSYPGGLKAVFINNRFVQIEPARRYAFNSALANGLEYTALDRFTSETSPDLLVSIESIGNQLAAFSSTTTEWFEDTGASPQPFRSTGIVADKGAAGPFTTAKMDNQLFVLADDGVFYRFQGYNPVRISTKPIEQAIRGKNWLNAFTTVWEDSGFAVCYWTFPDGETWGYDASSGKWHRRESYGFNRWRLNSLTFWQNAWYGGDFQNGRLWRLDWDYLLEGDEEIVSSRAAGVISDNQNRVIHERIELVMNTGMVETVPPSPLFQEQPEGPSISGGAPSGGVGEAYTYTYTTTPGTSPVSKTLLMPGSSDISAIGLSWNQVTATISGLPTESLLITLVLRVIDSNGLWAEMEDTIAIGYGALLASDVSGITRITASGDAVSWNSEPIIVGGNSSPAWFLKKIESRIFGYRLQTATPAAYSDDDGATWTLTAGNVVTGNLVGAGFSGGNLFLQGNGPTYLVSSDLGETFTNGAFPGSLFVEKSQSSGELACSDSGNLRSTADGGASWSTGIASGISFSSGGASGTDGFDYFFGGNLGVGLQPALVRYTGDSVTPIEIPAFTDGSSVSAFSYGNGIYVIGISDGGIAYDSGSGFVKPTFSFPGGAIQITFNGAQFIAVISTGGNGKIFHSIDAENWTESPLYAVNYRPHSVAILREAN